jgi:hypothetical protein
MATTTNYGWTTPDDTALVKDGAAAIRSLGTSVDTTTKNLNPETTLGDISYRSSTTNVNTRLPLGTAGQVLKVNSGATAPEWSSDNAGMTNPMTTTGDTIYSSSGSTPARLGIGSTGNVLTVSGGVPTWAAPASGGANWSLLNSGGTALTGAATITVSGISGKDKIMIIITSASSGSVNALISARLNTDTGANYNYFGNRINASSSYDPGNFAPANNASETEIAFGAMSGNANSSVSGYLLLSGCNSSGVKIFNSAGGATAVGNNGQFNYTVGGYYNSSSVISSISIFSNSGNFDAGTVYVYTSA